MNESVERERHREYVRDMDRIHRGIWILVGLLAMLGGTLARFSNLWEAVAAWLPALFFVALGGYCLALGTAGYEGFKSGQSPRASWPDRERRALCGPR